MSSKVNKNQETLGNHMWQRNLSDARDIRINLENILDDSFKLLFDLLNNFKALNDTDPVGLLLSLFTCIGHFCGESTVKITNHVCNLNLFLLIIGPSGSGKSKIIAPIKKSIFRTIKALSISKDDAGIVDDFTTASLSSKLAKSNVFIVTDEAEKPLLAMGFYSPLSEVSAADRIAGCKFFGTIPTTKDTMTYHLEINSHLSFVGATTGRLWHRLITFYSHGHQSDGFSERFLHYAMPKKNESNMNISQSLEYDDTDDDTNAFDDDISDDDYETEHSNNIIQNLPSLSQVLVVSRLIGKREFILSRNGTKKFYNKVRQYQELSQIDKPDDVNYGSRMGKAAEILCKLAAISEILKISMEILKLLKDQNQLLYDDVGFNFIRNVTQIIENKYSSTNITLQIQSSSCRVAGNLLCSHLLKMSTAFYNVEPVFTTNKRMNIEPISIHLNINSIREKIFRMPQLFFLKRDLTGTMGLLRHFPCHMVNTVVDELTNYELIRQGPYITTTSRGIVHMKSFPSEFILNDPIKRSVIDRMLNDVKMDLTTYMSIFCDSIIKDKQILTTNGQQILILPEHNLLYQNLKQKYPERNFDGSMVLNQNHNLHNINNQSVHTHTTTNQSTSDHTIIPIFTILNDTSMPSPTNSLNHQSHSMSSSNNITQSSSTQNLVLNNSINDQCCNLSRTFNVPNNEQNLSVDQFPSFELNIMNSSNINEKSSNFTQTEIIQERISNSPLNRVCTQSKFSLFDENTKDNKNVTCTIGMSNDIIPSNDNFTDSHKNLNHTSNTKEQNLMSPTTNILLSSSTLDDVTQQTDPSNNSNVQCTKQSSKIQHNQNLTSITISNTSDTSNSCINNPNSSQSKEINYSEPTSSSIQDYGKLDSSDTQPKKRKKNSTKNISPKRKYIKKIEK